MYDLESFIHASENGKHPSELDFRLDDLHLIGEKISFMIPETWGKMIIDPFGGHFQGFDALGFRHLLMSVKHYTVGIPAIRAEASFQNDYKKGDVLIPAKKPIAKRVFFEWHRHDYILPKYGREGFDFWKCQSCGSLSPRRALKCQDCGEKTDYIPDEMKEKPVDKKNETMYEAAVRLWGYDAQWLMVIEECSELIKAICKNERGEDNLDNLAEEIAHVQIVLDQAKTMIGFAFYTKRYVKEYAAFCERVKKGLKKNET
jgi:NTP pyrophosphatase (non-canonical NTP hydrolase)